MMVKEIILVLILLGSDQKYDKNILYQDIITGPSFYTKKECTDYLTSIGENEEDIITIENTNKKGVYICSKINYE